MKSYREFVKEAEKIIWVRTPGAAGGYTNRRVPKDYKPTPEELGPPVKQKSQEELEKEYAELTKRGKTKDGIKI